MHFVIIALVVVGALAALIAAVRWLGHTRKQHKADAKEAQTKRLQTELQEAIRSIVAAAKAGDAAGKEQLMQLTIYRNGYLAEWPQTIRVASEAVRVIPTDLIGSVEALQRTIRTTDLLAGTGQELVEALSSLSLTPREEQIGAHLKVLSLAGDIQNAKKYDHDDAAIETFMHPHLALLDLAREELPRLAHARLDELCQRALGEGDAADEAYDAVHELLDYDDLKRRLVSLEAAPLRYPASWPATVAKRLEEPSLEDYGPENLGGATRPDHLKRGDVAIMAAEALRLQDVVGAKLVFAYCNYGTLPGRKVVYAGRDDAGEILYTEIVKLVERANAEQAATSHVSQA